ncbi:MAG TPA: SLBB domain-containing protein, partial [Rubrivivax sp.]
MTRLSPLSSLQFGCHSPARRLQRLALVCLLALAAASSPSMAQQSMQSGQPGNGETANTGTTQLRQAPPSAADAASAPARGRAAGTSQDTLPAYVPGEFERFMRRQSGAEDLRRFGAELMNANAARQRDELMSAISAGQVLDISPLVPPDYVVAPGDELQVTLWGSIDADLQLKVDRTGRISIPRVGSIMVAGIRHADLTETISRRVAQVFKNYQLSASMASLRGVRVFVTGFAVAPGAYNLSSLSSITTALARAGGPAAAGSFRNVELRRANKVEAVFDLYDFMLRGDRSADRLIQAGDVIHVNAVGTQIAVIGSVNFPAIFELKPGEKVEDALRMSGGFSAVADRSRVAVERLDDRSTLRVTQLALPQGLGSALGNGDVVRAFSAVDAMLPVERQNKLVRVEGEVQRPGDYVLPASSSVADALRAAGGLTGAAYVFGTEFSRESTRKTQQESYERALRNLETDLARATATARVASTDEAGAQTARSAANTRLVERLRAIKPTGRIVLQ